MMMQAQMPMERPDMVDQGVCQIPGQGFPGRQQVGAEHTLVLHWLDAKGLGFHKGMKNGAKDYLPFLDLLFLGRPFLAIKARARSSFSMTRGSLL
jgi:hypothetical protein